MSYLLPTNFDQISDTFKAKIKNSYGISDTQFQGSNIAILADIMAYAVTMINTNMNFGIKESVLTYANTRKNIITLAREIGYEPAFRKSFKYEIKLRAKRGGLLEIPKFAKFNGGSNTYYYLNDTQTQIFGESCFLTITNDEIFKELKQREGTTSGDFVLSDTNEVFELLEKTDTYDDKRMLLNSVNTDKIDKYSTIKTSLYMIKGQDLSKPPENNIHPEIPPEEVEPELSEELLIGNFFIGNVEGADNNIDSTQVIGAFTIGNVRAKDNTTSGETIPGTTPENNNQNQNTQTGTDNTQQNQNTTQQSGKVEYLRLATIEAFVVDNSDENDKILICQLKDIDTKNFPTSDEEVLNIQFFTDDILKGHLNGVFNGFRAFEYNKTTQVLKFKISDTNNQITDSKRVTHTLDTMLTPFRKKRFCKLVDTNTKLQYDPALEFAILENSESQNEISIVVTEGELLSYETDSTLQITADAEDENRGYIVLDLQDVEEDGVFLEVSRVNSKNELILKQPFTQRKNYIPDSIDGEEDLTFIALEDFTNTQTYLKIFTQYAGTGTKFYVGNIFYFKVLKSKGIDGACYDLMSSELEDFEVINYYTAPVDKDGIKEGDDIFSKLFSTGANHESLESIKSNAPLYKNSADRLVTKNDYKTYCKKFQYIEQAQIWGGEELETTQELGHIYFSFIPKSRSREFEQDANNSVYTLKNMYQRELFFLPEKQILLQQDGGDKSSVFETLTKQKIITLQFHNIKPNYLDFTIECKLIKYLASKSEKEQRQMVFDGIKEYFDEIEKFDANIFHSNIVKYIDRKFNDETGIKLSVNLETSMIADDFSENGFNKVEKEKKKYHFQTLFEFPIGGIFEPDVVTLEGLISRYGAILKDKIPEIVNDETTGFLQPKDVVYMDYDNIKAYFIEQGKEVQKILPISKIDSSVKEFYIPLIHKETKNSLSQQIIGNLIVLPEAQLIYMELEATESENIVDLQTALPLTAYDKRRRLLIKTDGDNQLRRNTFPRLIKVFIE